MENDDTFVVDDVRFKGLEEGDAERWLACLGAARRGASRQDVARIWAPVDEARDVRGGSLVRRARRRPGLVRRLDATQHDLARGAALRPPALFS